MASICSPEQCALTTTASTTNPTAPSRPDCYTYPCLPHLHDGKSRCARSPPLKNQHMRSFPLQVPGMALNVYNHLFSALRPGSQTDTPLYAASEYGEYHNPTLLTFCSDSQVTTSQNLTHIYIYLHCWPQFVPTYSITVLLSVSLGVFSAIASSSPTSRPAESSPMSRV